MQSHMAIFLQFLYHFNMYVMHSPYLQHNVISYYHCREVRVGAAMVVVPRRYAHMPDSSRPTEGYTMMRHTASYALPKIV